MKNIKFIIILFALNSGLAFAFPKAPINDLNFRPGLVHKLGNDVSYDFEGIVKLSNCSGSLIKFEGQSESAKALVLTNGHCVPRGIFGGFLKPGEVMLNKSVNRKMKIFKDSKTLFDIKANKIIYATMTNTDIALYQLNESF